MFLSRIGGLWPPCLSNTASQFSLTISKCQLTAVTVSGSKRGGVSSGQQTISPLRCHGLKQRDAPCMDDVAVISAPAVKATRPRKKSLRHQAEPDLPRPIVPASVEAVVHTAAPSPPSARRPVSCSGPPSVQAGDLGSDTLIVQKAESQHVEGDVRGVPRDVSPPPRSLISDSDMVTDKSRLNPVYRMIRKKELQHKRGDWQHEWSDKDGSAFSPTTSSAKDDVPSLSSVKSSDGSTDGPSTNSLIDDSSMTSEKSRLNPVYRLIRKKELQKKKDLAKLRGPGPSLGDASASELNSVEGVATLDRRYRRVSPISPLSDSAAAAPGRDRINAPQRDGVDGTSQTRDKMRGGDPGPLVVTNAAPSSTAFLLPPTGSSEVDAGRVSSSISSCSRMVQESEMANDQAKMNPVFR